MSSNTVAGEMSVHQRLLEIIKCPVCLNPVKGNPFQCVLGHVVCSQCYPRLVHCPLCRSPFAGVCGETVTQICNLIPIPCENRTSGCLWLDFGSRMITHESRCKFKSLGCHFKSPSPCPWQGLACKYFEHCLEAHKSNTKTLVKFPDGCNFEVDDSVSFYSTSHVWKRVFKYKRNGLFVIVVRVCQFTFILKVKFIYKTQLFHMSSRELYDGKHTSFVFSLCLGRNPSNNGDMPFRVRIFDKSGSAVAEKLRSQKAREAALYP